MSDVSIEGLIAQLNAITDPEERARAAHRLFSTSSLHLRDVRDLAINELRFQRNLSLREIAELLSNSGHPISKSRIADIVA